MDEANKKYYEFQVNTIDERLKDPSLTVDRHVIYHFEKAGWQVLLGLRAGSTMSIAKGVKLAEMLRAGQLDNERK